MPAGTYFGQRQTGAGRPIPVNAATGAVDINAVIGQMVDRRKTYYYDTLKFAPGATVVSQPYQMFKNQIGTADQYNGSQTKTEVETNMTSSGMFNPPYDCIVNNLGFKFAEDNLIFDITQIVKLCFFEFKILEKRMWSGHLWRHPPGAGFSGMTTQTSESVWNNGVPNPQAVWLFGDYKKYIPPLVNFSMTINFPETYNQYYNSSLPANVTVKLGAVGSSLPQIETSANGGNGIALTAFLNGLSDGPVQ